MISLKIFRSIVSDHVASLPPMVIIDRAIIRAAREFCVKSGSLRVDHVVDIQAGVSEYPLSFDDGNTAFFSLTEGGASLVSPYRQLPAVSSLSFFSGSGAPREVKVSPYALFVSPTPSKSFQIRLEMMMQPSLAAKEISSELFEEWGEYIAFGAAYYLGIQNDKPWSDPQHAGVMLEEFRRGVREAKQRAMFGASNESLIIKADGFIL